MAKMVQDMNKKELDQGKRTGAITPLDKMRHETSVDASVYDKDPVNKRGTKEALNANKTPAPAEAWRDKGKNA